MYVSACTYICVRTLLYVSAYGSSGTAYCYICLRMLLYEYPHSPTYVSAYGSTGTAYCCICLRMLLYAYPHSPTCVRIRPIQYCILLCMCLHATHTTTCVSSYVENIQVRGGDRARPRRLERENRLRTEGEEAENQERRS